MARRSGKAARRQSRQKRAQRESQRSAQPRRQDPKSEDARPDAVGGVSETTSGPGVVATSDKPADSPPEGSARPPVRRSRAGSRLTTGSSSLAEFRGHYHYVERELRNIFLLSVLLIVLLGVAAIAFNVLDLVPA